MVTGRPSIALKISLKSPFCIGRSWSIAPWRSSAVRERIISRTIGSRSAALNMRSVRQSPIPSAPISLASAASSAVSALARTPRERSSSAHMSNVFMSSLNSGSTVGTSPRKTFPAPPSIVITSPSVMRRPLTTATRSRSLILISSAPTTQGLPMPRATTAA